MASPTLPLLFFLFFFSLPTLQTTYYVAIDGDDSSSGNITNPFKTVGKAVSNTIDGDTILLFSGNYVDQGNLHFQIVSKITIGAVLPSSFPVIDCRPFPEYLLWDLDASITIENIIFRNCGYLTMSQIPEDGVVNLNSVRFLGHNPSLYPTFGHLGSLYVAKNFSALNLNDCFFSQTILRFGHNHYQDVTSTKITVNSCSFEESTIEINHVVNIDVLNSKFQGEHLKRVAVSSFDGPMTLENCDFMGFSTTVLEFNGYESPLLKANNCTFSSNSGGGAGGVIRVYNGVEGSFTNCVFSQNYGKNGGVFYASEKARGIFNNCLFGNNKAEQGGGVFYISKGSSVIGNNNIIEYNSAYKGAYVFCEGSGCSYSCKGCVYTDNTAEEYWNGTC